MSIKNQLNESMKDAMKSGDEVRKRTVRMALAAVKQAEVDKRIELDDPAVMSLLQKEIKNRREALEEAKISVKSGNTGYIPKNKKAISGRDAEVCLNLMDMLDDHDDIQNAYADSDISDDEMARIAG